MSDATPEPQTRTTTLLRNTAILLVVLLLLFVVLDRAGVFVIARNVIGGQRLVANHKWTVVDPATLTWPANPTVASLFTTAPATGRTSLGYGPPYPRIEVDVAAARLPNAAPFVLVVARPRDVPPESPAFFIDIKLGLITRVPAGIALPERTEPAVHMWFTGAQAAALHNSPLPPAVYDAFSAAITQHKITATLPYGIANPAPPIVLPAPVIATTSPEAPVDSAP